MILISKDHPCVCRNIFFLRRFFFSVKGSPLRVQEHFTRSWFKFTVSWITPACAGTFYKGYACDKNIWDHPCVCRNILQYGYLPTSIRGSPLRVQEHSKISTTIANQYRITPACAGTFNGLW